jgi:hypothetical protein
MDDMEARGTPATYKIFTTVMRAFAMTKDLEQVTKLHQEAITRVRLKTHCSCHSTTLARDSESAWRQNVHGRNAWREIQKAMIILHDLVRVKAVSLIKQRPKLDEPEKPPNPKTKWLNLDKSNAEKGLACMQGRETVHTWNLVLMAINESDGEHMAGEAESHDCSAWPCVCKPFLRRMKIELRNTRHNQRELNET